MSILKNYRRKRYIKKVSNLLFGVTKLYLEDFSSSDSDPISKKLYPDKKGRIELFIFISLYILEKFERLDQKTYHVNLVEERYRKSTIRYIINELGLNYYTNNAVSLIERRYNLYKKLSSSNQIKTLLYFLYRNPLGDENNKEINQVTSTNPIYEMWDEGIKKFKAHNDFKLDVLLLKIVDEELGDKW